MGFKITADGDCSHEIKIAGEDINNLSYADDTTLTVESEEELKSLFMRVNKRRVKNQA